MDSLVVSGKLDVALGSIRNDHGRNDHVALGSIRNILHNFSTPRTP